MTAGSAGAADAPRTHARALTHDTHRQPIAGSKPEAGGATTVQARARRAHADEARSARGRAIASSLEVKPDQG